MVSAATLMGVPRMPGRASGHGLTASVAVGFGLGYRWGLPVPGGDGIRFLQAPVGVRTGLIKVGIIAAPQAESGLFKGLGVKDVRDLGGVRLSRDSGE